MRLQDNFFKLRISVCEIYAVSFLRTLIAFVL